MIALGADHAGYEAKENLKKHLEKSEIPFKDFGTHSKQSCDYPLIASEVCKSILSGESERGILICGSGIGMSIAANKFKGIRAALCCDENTASLSRGHNDANVICLGARGLDFARINKIVDAFLNTSFEGGRHQRRINQIKEIENL